MQQRNAELWHKLALVFGYNQLAKTSETLGEKVYCRMLRDLAEKDYIELGGVGSIDRTKEPPVLVIDYQKPYIIFTEKDNRTYAALRCGVRRQRPR